MAKFQKGASGNPAGRPKGIRDRRHKLRDTMLEAADGLVTMAIAYAKAGDMAAMRLVFDRIMPAVKQDPIEFAMPKLATAAECAAAQATVVQAVVSGQLLPSEGQVMTGLIEAQRRAFETSDLAEQLRTLAEEITKLKEKRT